MQDSFAHAESVFGRQYNRYSLRGDKLQLLLEDDSQYLFNIPRFAFASDLC